VARVDPLEESVYAWAVDARRDHPPRIRHHHTYEAYLEHESGSNVKHEFLDGEIYAMAGGSRQHAALSVAVSAALHIQLRGAPCVVFSSDLKVRVVETGLATYPDVTVVCGPVEEDAVSKHVVLNPTLVVEVTSPSSEEWDRGDKLDHYKRMPSLQGCLLVSHVEPKLELVSRQPDGTWARQTARSGESLSVPFLEATLVVDELYRNVDLAA
jgi:Uma2 family endonuclease